MPHIKGTLEIFTGLFFFLLSNNRNTAWDSTFQHFCVDNDRIGIHTVLTFYANFTILSVCIVGFQ